MTSRWARRLALAAILLAVILLVLLVFNGVIGGEEDPGSGEEPVPAERR